MHYRRLRDIREDRDLSQDKIAGVLGIPQTQYSRYERGLREIPACHIVTLAKYYNVSADYLLGLRKSPGRLTRAE